MKRFIIYISFLLVAMNAFAQQEEGSIPIDSVHVSQKNFDADKIEDYKKQNDFNYETEEDKENMFTAFWNWVKRVVKKILSFFFDDIAPAVGFLAILLRALPWLIALLALYFILRFFLKVNARNIIEGKTNKTIVHISDDDELLLNQDLKKLLKEAINNKDYRVAIRYYYLYNLQKLSDKEFIVWQQEKTNEDYIREIQNETIKPVFIETTRLYDFVWYGNFNINESEFTKAQVLFNQLTKHIG